MSTINILFTSSGRRVSLIKHFKKVLTESEDCGKIITADFKSNAPTAFICDIHELVPKVTSLKYITTLLEICKRHKIKLLIPLIDTELLLLSENVNRFRDIGVIVLVCSQKTNRICGDKKCTADFFKEIGIDTPTILEADNILRLEAARYPFFLKPADGSSSIDAVKINTREELLLFKKYIPNAIIQEFINGDEYTIDVLVDFNGKVRSVVPRLRIETRAGEVSKGMTVKNREIIAAAKKVAQSLPGVLGCLTLQCFLSNNGAIKFIEINPRFGGGFPLSIAAGADFPRWIIEIMQGKKPDIAIDQWQEGVVMLRYDDAVFTTKDNIK